MLMDNSPGCASGDRYLELSAALDAIATGRGTTRAAIIRDVIGRLEMGIEQNCTALAALRQLEATYRTN